MTGKWDLEPEMAPTRQVCTAHHEVVEAQQEQTRLTEEYHQEDIEALRDLGKALGSIQIQVSEINGMMKVLMAQQTGMGIHVGPQSSGQTVSLQVPHPPQDSKHPWGQILGVIVGALAVLGCLVPGSAQAAIEMIRGLVK